MGVAAASSPSTVIGNTNQDVVQTLALVNAGGDELAREHQWQTGTLEHRFTTVYYQYTATLSTSSTTITAMSSTTGLTTSPTFFHVTGTGVPEDTTLVSVNAGASTAVLSRTPTVAGSGVTLTFSQTTYSLPSDFDRIIDRTEWDKTRRQMLNGPKTGQQWQWLKGGIGATTPSARFRIQGGNFKIWPPLGAEYYFGFEYQSKFWVLVTSGTAVTKQAFSVDTDTCMFPDPLMRALIKLKYWEVKGFDTTALYRDYTAQRDLAKAHDAGSPTLNMAPKPTELLLGWDNIPDTGYGS